MKDVSRLLEECQALGASFRTVGRRVFVRAEKPLPGPLMDALRAARPQVKAAIDARCWAECWVLWEWRRVSIPEWRRILAESMEAGDQERTEYAVWMLGEVLQHADCMEAQE